MKNIKNYLRDMAIKKNYIGEYNNFLAQIKADFLENAEREYPKVSHHAIFHIIMKCPNCNFYLSLSEKDDLFNCELCESNWILEEIEFEPNIEYFRRYKDILNF